MDQKDIPNMDLDTPRMIESKIESLLEKEKEQMIKFAYGFYDECFTKDGIIQKTAADYYNDETYN